MQTTKVRDLASALGFIDLAATLRVVWNARLRTTAGRAHLGAGLIELNPRLQTVSDDEIDRTLRHELAHLLTDQQFGRAVQPHGREWRLMCAKLGIAGEKACHTLPWQSARMARPFVYSCLGCGVEVTRARRMKARRACAKCCREHNGGKFSRRFIFQLVRIERGSES